MSRMITHLPSCLGIKISCIGMGTVNKQKSVYWSCLYYIKKAPHFYSAYLNSIDYNWLVNIGLDYKFQQ